MNKLIYISIIGILLSCQNSTINTSKRKVIKSHKFQNQDTLNSSHKIAQKKTINNRLKENLRGIWASDQYREKLFKLNSLTSAQKAITTYTDIVFDGKEILHCSRPSYMEEDYLTLNPDSTVTNPKGKLIFEILKIKNKTMKIKSAENKIYTFKRVVEKADTKRIFDEINKGSMSIERDWIAGSYKIMLDTLLFKAKLLNNGSVQSAINLKSIPIYSYDNRDIITFNFNQDSVLFYAIKKYTDTLIRLEGIESLWKKQDMPVVPNGKTGYMKKIQLDSQQ